jgi:hypothetical protein
MEIFWKIEAGYFKVYLFFVNFFKKTVLAVTILLRKVARCILGIRNRVLTLYEKTTQKQYT